MVSLPTQRCNPVYRCMVREGLAESPDTTDENTKNHSSSPAAEVTPVQANHQHVRIIEASRPGEWVVCRKVFNRRHHGLEVARQLEHVARRLFVPHSKDIAARAP
eukprot:7270885-Prymnesium_polylepis.1